jgi:hypothetical protein
MAAGENGFDQFMPPNPPMLQSTLVPSLLAAARDRLHRTLIEREALALRNGVVTTADRASAPSRRISELMAASFCERLGLPPLTVGAKVDAGSIFEACVREFLETTLAGILSGRGPWAVEGGGSIGRFAQYAHLQEIEELSREHPELHIYLGGDYLVTPDICVSRRPIDDAVLGDEVMTDEDGLARDTFLRSKNNERPLIHASVSCKWTLRSDRAQNARTEALNLLRNRKGRAPAIVLVTAEPLPTRLASLAYGTGDVDRIYHLALYELQDAVAQSQRESPRYIAQKTALDRMVDGLRLADISDLPFDLLI